MEFQNSSLSNETVTTSRSLRYENLIRRAFKFLAKIDLCYPRSSFLLTFPPGADKSLGNGSPAINRIEEAIGGTRAGETGGLDRDTMTVSPVEPGRTCERSGAPLRPETETAGFNVLCSVFGSSDPAAEGGSRT